MIIVSINVKSFSIAKHNVEILRFKIKFVRSQLYFGEKNPSQSYAITLIINEKIRYSCFVFLCMSQNRVFLRTKICSYLLPFQSLFVGHTSPGSHPYDHHAILWGEASNFRRIYLVCDNPGIQTCHKERYCYHKCARRYQY